MDRTDRTTQHRPLTLEGFLDGLAEHVSRPTASGYVASMVPLDEGYREALRLDLGLDRAAWREVNLTPWPGDDLRKWARLARCAGVPTRDLMEVLWEAARARIVSEVASRDAGGAIRLILSETVPADPNYRVKEVMTHEVHIKDLVVPRHDDGADHSPRS